MKNIAFLNSDVLSYEPRTVEPDIVSRWPPTEVSEGYNYEAVQENYVITDNRRILRVYYVQPLQHVEGMLMAYLPAERIAFQADLFDTHEPPQAAQLPAMRSLATQVAAHEARRRDARARARPAGALERVRASAAVAGRRVLESYRGDDDRAQQREHEGYAVARAEGGGARGRPREGRSARRSGLPH